MMYLLWLLYFLPNLAIEVMCMVLAPLVACFITKAERTDRVKRLGNGQVTLMREYLIRPLYWFQTHDNAVDEYWWGTFYKTSMIPYVRNASQADYDSSAWLRYLCRVLWLWRNCAYGFSYNLFGRDLIGEEVVTETGNEKSGKWQRFTLRTNSWQLKAHYPIGFGLQLDVNIGWKVHKGFPRAMYADRIISFRYNQG